jgi:CSLREA domain-containing protein
VWGVRGILIGLMVLLPAGSFRANTFEVTKTADTDGDCRPQNCSLREAIAAANTRPGVDDVSVPAGTYLLGLGRLVVSDDVVIAGAGADSTIIDGDAADRVFDLSGVVEISGITIQNGFDPVQGGGVYNTADLTITNSTLSNNRAVSRGGGIFNMGATVTLTNSTVSGNSSGYGAGLNNRSGTMYLTNSTVSGNDAAAPAVQPFPEDYVGYGGGIFNTGSIAISNSVIVKNYAFDDGGGIDNSTGSVTLSNTIVAQNFAVGYGPNCDYSQRNPITSLGYNLMESGLWCGSPVTEDRVVSDAMVGPLADNGGPTETHALLAGSPAIDAGGPDCPPPATDQRGVTRPQGASCDIGSVEYVPEPRGPVALIAGAVFLGGLYHRRR